MTTDSTLKVITLLPGDQLTFNFHQLAHFLEFLAGGSEFLLRVPGNVVNFGTYGYLLPYLNNQLLVLVAMATPHLRYHGYLIRCTLVTTNNVDNPPTHTLVTTLVTTKDVYNSPAHTFITTLVTTNNVYNPPAHTFITTLVTTNNVYNPPAHTLVTTNNVYNPPEHRRRDIQV